jgi:protein-tyrosine phosphatase
LNPYWIKADVRLGIAPRPRGNDWLGDDVLMLRRAGVEILVSALTASESDELGLSEEQSCCTREGILFVSYPIEDRSVPSSFSEFSKLIESLDNKLRLGKAVAVHCRAGVGRSSIIVAGLLSRNGATPESAFRAIEDARGCSVPDTPEQRQWVERFLTTAKE